MVGVTALECLLTDIMHWCEANQADFNVLLKLVRKRRREDRKEPV